MTGLAAGMASEGYHVFTYSIANFPTFRCAEQIRNDVDYQQLPVTVVAVGGAVSRMDRLAIRTTRCRTTH